MLKMFGLNAEPQVRSSKTAGVSRRSSRLSGPKFTDLGQMRRPVVNVRVEDWAKHLMLPNIGVEIMQQPRNPFLATYSLKQ